MKYYAYKNAKGRMNQPGDLPTNLAGLSDETLKTHGYYPVEMPEISLEANQVFSHYTMSFADDTVTATPVIRGMTDEEIAAKLEARKEELAALRYEKEIAGVTVGGFPILTDRLTQSMLTGAFVACQTTPERTLDWKGANGWTELNALQITAIATAVADHVQACFTREKELSALLDTDIDTDITTGWPE